MISVKLLVRTGRECEIVVRLTLGEINVGGWGFGRAIGLGALLFGDNALRSIDFDVDVLCNNDFDESEYSLFTSSKPCKPVAAVDDDDGHFDRICVDSPCCVFVFVNLLLIVTPFGSNDDTDEGRTVVVNGNKADTNEVKENEVRYDDEADSSLFAWSNG